MFDGMSRLARRVRAWFDRRSQFEAEMEDEIAFHLERATEENIKSGMTRLEARRAARLRFGGIDQIKEDCRDTRPVRILREGLQDLRYGLRTLGKSPGFAAVSILTLALGVGANTAIFSLIDALLIKNLPVADPQELALVEPFHGDQGRAFSYPMFRDIAARQEVLSAIYASGGVEFGQVRVDGIGDFPSPETVQGRFVSTNYFSVLGVNPVLGRAFDTRNDQEAVISYGFWERYLGKDRSVLNRTITLNKASFAIVGVAPRKFFGESPGIAIDVWIPIEAQPLIEPRSLLQVRTASWFRTLGRLKPGISTSQAEVRLSMLYRQLLADEIASGTGSLIHKAPRLEDTRVDLSPGGKGFSWYRQQLAHPLWVLMAVTGVVLLIACSNLANLLMARASSRQREIDIRLALGAGRFRLIRQFLTESLLLASLGGAAGLGLFFVTRNVLLAMASVQLDLGPDIRVLVFSASLAVWTGVLFGLAPALQATRLRVVPTSHAGTAQRSRVLIPKLIVVGQTALSLVLLVGAGLLLRTLQNFRDLDPGFVREKVLLFDLSREASSDAPLTPLFRQIQERLDGLPGVRSVGFCAFGFFGGGANTIPVRVPDSEANPAGDREIRTEWVSPGYFDALGMKLAAGRDLTFADKNVCVINETMARHYFDRRSPLGKFLYFPKSDSQGRYIPFSADLAGEQAVQIVGVVRDAHYDDLRQETPRMAYLPWSEAPSFASSVVVRTAANPLGVVESIRSTLRQLSPNLQLRQPTALEDQVNGTLFHERLLTKLLAFFGLLALLLVSVGLYGLMSYSVARRTREIGVRMALGARRIDALGMVLKSTFSLGLMGTLLGLPSAIAATQLVKHFLFGVRPFDPATIGLATVVLLLVFATAGCLPAWRASRVDPALALREE